MYKIFAIILVLISACFSKNSFVSAQTETLNFVSLFDTTKTKMVSCYRIPSLAVAPNGNLIAAIDERVPNCGDLKWSNDINIVVRRSIDNGITWSDIETVVDYPLGKSASDPSMIVDNVTNEIFLFFNYMDLILEKDVYYLMVTKSTDNGKTWSKPVDITTQITKPEWHNHFKFITSGSGIQTKNGKLLHTLVNLQQGLFVFTSDDHGQTWQLIATPIKPADESKVVELPDGTWMVNSRVNNLGHRFVHTSNDAGKTWQSYADTTLIDPGCNASIISYNLTMNGITKPILLFANANHSTDRKNLTIKISYDNGKNWSQGKTIYAGGAAYVSMVAMANDSIAFFFEKDDYKDNVFVSISIKWITDEIK
jgi:sialidase-1